MSLGTLYLGNYGAIVHLGHAGFLVSTVVGSNLSEVDLPGPSKVVLFWGFRVYGLVWFCGVRINIRILPKSVNWRV